MFPQSEIVRRNAGENVEARALQKAPQIPYNFFAEWWLI